MEYIFGDKLVKFTDEVVEILNSYRQVKKKQHEAGGILLGRIFDDQIIIQQITTPGPGDKSGRYFFERNVKRAQWFVDLAWRSSNGEVIYLGEWHTHPEPVPRPSSVDQKLITNMLRDSKMSIDFLFLVIVGTEEKYVAVQFVGSDTSLKQLEQRISV
ncbi:Mov34/MPN/PAD-1 family protein [Paenibacillus thailandensis]|uniref:Mov34/MPN/PAD-1 family protein n=1 Tax=Paenibacillus thailandensis TaxID=393250 RepID=A0ABW5QVE2_9BACL